MDEKRPFCKPWSDLDFSDNFIFCKVMKNEKLCKQMLEILLDIEIDHLEYLQTEDAIENFYDSRGIRLDVFVKDSDRFFDLEMQTCNYTDLLLRTRYYQGTLDLSETNKGCRFSELKESYIIFLCKEDPIGAGGYVYTKNSNFKEFPNISFNDKTNVVFYNSKAYNKAEKPEVRDVLEFIYNFKSNSTFTDELAKSVLEAKDKPEWRKEYMFFYDVLEDEKMRVSEESRAAGLAEGKAAGLAEGLAEGKVAGAKQERIDTVKKLYNNGNMKINEIAEILQISVEEIKKILS